MYDVYFNNYAVLSKYWLNIYYDGSEVSELDDAVLSKGIKLRWN